MKGTDSLPKAASLHLVLQLNKVLLVHVAVVSQSQSRVSLILRGQHNAAEFVMKWSKCLFAYGDYKFELVIVLVLNVVFMYVTVFMSTQVHVYGVNVSLCPSYGDFFIVHSKVIVHALMCSVCLMYVHMYITFSADGKMCSMCS